jgi:hypothetical protein
LRHVVQVERQKNRAFFMMSDTAAYSMSCSPTGPVPESPGPVMLVVKCVVELEELYRLCEGIETGGAPTPAAGDVDAELLEVVLE